MAGANAVLTDANIARLVEGNEAKAYAALIEAASPAVLSSTAIRVERVAGAYAFVAAGVRDALLLNRVVGLGVFDPLTKAVVDEIDRLYRQSGATTYAAEVATVGTLGLAVSDLQEMGFVPFRQTTMMYRDTVELPEAATQLLIRPAEVFEAQRFAQMCCAVFGFSEPFPSLIESSFYHSRLTHWMAFDGNVPAGAAMSADMGDGTGWIGWVCTLPAYRGRGVQSSLAKRQLQDFADKQVKCVSLEASTGTKRRPSITLRNYTRLGWIPAYDRLVLLRRLAS